VWDTLLHLWNTKNNSVSTKLFSGVTPGRSDFSAAVALRPTYFTLTFIGVTVSKKMMQNFTEVTQIYA
jgi:hypothetical protein